MTVKIGDIIEDAFAIYDLPFGTSVVRIGTSEVKVRGSANHNWFADGSQATIPGSRYVVVGLPGALDLSDRNDLALAVRRASQNDQTIGNVEPFEHSYFRIADMIREHFELKSGDRTLRIGSRIKVVNTDRSWAPRHKIGEYATVELEDKSDGTWFVAFDNGKYWVHTDEVEVVG